MRKMAKKFSALLLVMSIVTLVWLVWLVYALLEPPPVLYAYNAILYEGTPDEWYEPEQLDLGVNADKFNTSLLLCTFTFPKWIYNPL